MGVWGYLLFIVPLVIYEVYAIRTNKYDTISEILWKVGKKHWLFRLITFLICLWALIHIVVGECAFGIC